MDKFLIQGGISLKGRVSASGSKNAALPILMSAILSEGQNIFYRVPDLRDTRTTLSLLERLGVKVQKGEALTLSANGLCQYEAPYELVRTMRASVLILGPVLAKMHKATVSLPGGCAIGARPINLHLKAFQKMGATIEIEGGYVKAEARRLHGDKIYFDTVTVTGTENVMMAAALAKGETLIENAAREPEVFDLACVLTKMGAKIEGAGTDTIHIQGVDSLSSCEHTIMPDRIETGTWMMAVAMTKGDVEITDTDPVIVEALTRKLQEVGVSVEADSSTIHVKGPTHLKATDMTTAPYPGFATDFQPLWMALATLAEGTSVIREEIFENRFIHVGELNRMGAKIQAERDTAVVQGVKSLSGAPVMASDLRAGMALVLAGLAAHGTTTVQRVYHIDRGYEDVETKLKNLGARIERVS